MNCPKCHATMESIVYSEIEIDRCTQCQGIWFDMFEAEHLKQLDGSEEIDSGDFLIGQQMDRIRQVDCPRCSARMIPMVDQEKPYLRFESCILCYGIYFDAGEFRAFKSEDRWAGRIWGAMRERLLN
jgi:uncharacterized protein